jgi:hypothetical protein
MKSNALKKSCLSVTVLVAALLASAQAEPIIALTTSNQLLTFDSVTPATITKSVTVSGLAGAEFLVGIDFRPGTGRLYGLTNMSRLYLINSDNGDATVVGSSGAFTLSGTRFGVDFNPVVDLVRVTSDADQNIRLNPNTGALTATDTPLQYATADSHVGANPNVVGSAYTNNFSTAGTTILYGIDSGFDILVIQNPPNGGTLTTVGALGVDTTDNVGFDISGTSGILYASLTVGGTTGLYTINQLSGAATLVGTIADAGTLGGASVIDIAAGVLPSSKLLNISTRGRVAPGEDVLIAGFITRSGVSSRYLLRALGPSLSGSGVTAPLADPVLTLYDNNGAVIATNDNWLTGQASDVSAAGLGLTNVAESAIIAILTPNTYTAIVSGKGGATGIAVVEVYQLL